MLKMNSSDIWKDIPSTFHQLDKLLKFFFWDWRIIEVRTSKPKTTTFTKLILYYGTYHCKCLITAGLKWTDGNSWHHRLVIRIDSDAVTTLVSSTSHFIILLVLSSPTPPPPHTTSPPLLLSPISGSPNPSCCHLHLQPPPLIFPAAHLPSSPCRWLGCFVLVSSTAKGHCGSIRHLLAAGNSELG